MGDEIFERFHITEVHSGGMSFIYRVRPQGMDFGLAVKRPRPERYTTPHDLEAFEREAATWVELGLQPNVVPCFFVRPLRGVPLLFAEWVEGGTVVAQGKFLTTGTT